MAGVELVAISIAETRLNGHTFSDDRIQVSPGVICKKRSKQIQYFFGTDKAFFGCKAAPIESGCRSQTTYFDYVYFEQMIIMDVIIVSGLHTDVN